jgi:hypothetical protein
MYGHSPSPANPYVPAPGVSARGRWQYLAIGATVVALGGTCIFALVHSFTAAPASSAVVTPRAPGLTPVKAAPDTVAGGGASDDMAADGSGLTADDAQALVDDSASLEDEARWDEALDRLTSITDPTQRTQLGADALTTQLRATEARWTTLRGQVDTQVAAKQWSAANTTIAQLAAIAHLDDTLLATRTSVRLQLAPPAPVVKAAPKPAATTKPATSAGHSSTATTTGDTDDVSASTAKPVTIPPKNANATSAAALLAGVSGTGSASDKAAAVSSLISAGMQSLPTGDDDSSASDDE